MPATKETTACRIFSEALASAKKRPHANHAGRPGTRRQPDPTLATRRQGSGLRCVAPDPLVGRRGVPPEVLLRDSSRLRQKILLRNREDLVDRRHAVAVGPIAAEENPVLTEDADESVESRAIGAEVGRHLSVHAVNDL